ncbi:MAG: polyphosphate polymerase domain-containing protein [Clostridia bacterium]|nr:polyphosphate polymerase domain-containing protein [Clostridia bacterium]
MQTIFQRHEIKYRITRAQQERVMAAIGDRMRADSYGVSTIRNVYFDTPDHRLIRRSLEKPVYKEMLRVRGYATAREDSTVFVELKKKYKGVVYKRRVALPEVQAMAFLCGREMPGDTQILREIDYLLDYYGCLRPTMFLSYDRQAFYDREDPGLRLTFDDRILWRQERMRLTEEVGGRLLLPPDTVLMEIKTATALPLWLTEILTRERIYKSPFSKYGTAYLETVQENSIYTEEENRYV